jgi:O-antigen/teichoic acid export membrane protein
MPSAIARWWAKQISDAASFRDSPIIRNAASLYGSTIITSALGYFYWLVAARMISAQAVGIASAIQSAASFLSIVCVLGVSTFLVSVLARDNTNARSLILTASAGVGSLALVLAIVVGICLERFSAVFRQGLSSPIALIVFALLSALSAVSIVVDDSCIGLLRGYLQLRRNSVFSVSKLLILPILIAAWRPKSGSELVVAWLAGLAISLATVSRGLRRPTLGQSSRLNFRRFIEQRSLMARHHWLNVAIQAPRLVLPVLVATIVGSRANASFTIALLVVSIAAIIPNHLSTVLFALAPGDEAALRHEVQRTMRFCLILAVATAPFFVLFSGVILHIFGRSYESATPSMIVLGFTVYPSAIKAHYAAIARVRGRMHQAAVLAMIGAGLEIGLAAAGGAVYGETGVAIGLLTAMVLEGAFFSPTVFGVLRAARMPETDI